MRPGTTLMLPTVAGEFLAELLVEHAVRWRIGIGDGAALDHHGNARRHPSGRPVLANHDRRQTGLVGSSQAWKSLDDGFPLLRGGAIVVQATFTPEELKQFPGDLTEAAVTFRHPVSGERVLLMRVPADFNPDRGEPWTAWFEIVL